MEGDALRRVLDVSENQDRKIHHTLAKMEQELIDQMNEQAKKFIDALIGAADKSANEPTAYGKVKDIPAVFSEFVDS